MVVHFVHPVVRTEVQIHAAIVYHVAQRGVGVQFAVAADEQLAFGYVEHVVAQRVRIARVRVNHVDGSVVVCVGVCHTHGVDEVVLQRTVIQFIILSGVLDDVIVLYALRVAAPLGIHRHGSFAGLAFLGRDDDDAIGTARAVQGVGSCVLQDRHRLDVLRAQVIHVAVVGHTVQDDERIVSGIDGADTSDADSRRRSTRLARSVVQLYAGNLTAQGIGHIGSLDLLDIFRSDHGG